MRGDGGRDERAGEHALIERLKRGEDAAFDELVRAQTPRLLAMARRMLGSEHDARDAVQEGLLAVFRAIDGFHGEASLATWVYRIVTNAALMRIRARSRRREESIEHLLPRFLEDGHEAEPTSAWQIGADVAVEREQTRALVRAAIAELPEAYRTVLTLRDVEDLDTDEVAEILGVTANCVKVRLHRARQALRKLLAPSFEAPRSERKSLAPAATTAAMVAAAAS